MVCVVDRTVDDIQKDGAADGGLASLNIAK